MEQDIKKLLEDVKNNNIKLNIIKGYASYYEYYELYTHYQQ